MLSPVDEKYQQIQAWERQGDDAGVAGICGLLGDEEAQVRGQAAQVLGKLGSRLAVAPLLAAINDKDGAARLKIIEAIGRIGDPAGVPGLIKLLEDAMFARLMMGMRPPGGEGVPLVQLQRAQGHAWDVLWAAATALGRIGDPAGLSAVLHWAERLALSDVRIFSIEEKSELVRAIVETLLPRLTPADIYDLSKSIHPSAVSLSWEPVIANGDDFHWAAAVRDNPLHRLFKAELERRKNEYMKTLRNPVADTLFSAPKGQGGSHDNAADTLFGSGQARSAQAANLADTLFGTREAAAANVADTLFSSNDHRAPAQFQSHSGPPVSAEDVNRLRESLITTLTRHESAYFPSRAAIAAAGDDLEEVMTPEIAQAKAQAHQKTLGKADTLFSTSHLNPEISVEFDEEEMLFLNEDQAREKQDVKLIPSARPELMTPDEVAAKMAAYQKTLGKGDTLFSTSHIKTSEIPTNWMDDDDLFETGEGVAGAEEEMAAAPPSQAPVAPPPPTPVAPILLAPPKAPDPEPLVYRPRPVEPIEPVAPPVEPALPAVAGPIAAPLPEPQPLVYRPKSLDPVAAPVEPIEPVEPVLTPLEPEATSSQEPSFEQAAREETPLEPLTPPEPITAGAAPSAAPPIYEEAPPLAPQPQVPAAVAPSAAPEGFDPNMRLPHPLRTQPKPIPAVKPRVTPPPLPQAGPTAPAPKRGIFARFFGWLFRR